MTDTLEIFGTEYTGVTGIIATTPNETDLTYIRPQGTKSITANGSGIDVVNYASVNVNVPSGQPTLQTKTKTYTPTESAQTESVTADSGYDGLDAVNVTVNAMPTGTAGTPAITVGALARGERKISASVTNTAGYIDGGTLDADSVYLSATEFVTGSETITKNGHFDVTTLESVEVNVPSSSQTIQSLTVTPTTSQQTFNASGVDGYKPVTVNAMPSGMAGTPTATKGTVSNHSISVTPKVTNSAGYITGSTKTGTAVTVSASELVSGTLSLTDNGTSDCTNYASVNVNIPFVTYYTGTSTPASSLGSNGDIYLKVVS